MQSCRFLRERFGLRANDRDARHSHDRPGRVRDRSSHRRSLSPSREPEDRGARARLSRATSRSWRRAPPRTQPKRMIAPLRARDRTSGLRASVFGIDDETPASAILRALRARGGALALAESCTGGRIAAALTASREPRRASPAAIVAYDNAVKIARARRRRAETIARYGAVSEEVGARDGARARGFGCERRCRARDDRHRRPERRHAGEAGRAGVVRAGRRAPGGARVALQLNGDRDAVVRRATTAALNLCGATSKVRSRSRSQRARVCVARRLVEGRQRVGFAFDLV